MTSLAALTWPVDLAALQARPDGPDLVRAAVSDGAHGELEGAARDVHATVLDAHLSK